MNTLLDDMDMLAKIMKKKGKEAPVKGKDKKPAGSDAPKKKLPVKKIIIYVVVLAVIGGAGYGGYKFFTRPKVEKPMKAQELVNVKLSQELIDFSFLKIKDLYDTVRDMNNRIFLIEKEVERLDKIAEEHPHQIKIVEKEKKGILKLLDKLKKTLEKIEAGIESYYVAVRVNRDEGEKLIESKAESLNKTGRDVLEQTDDLADRIRVYHIVKTGFVSKIKDKILGFF